MAHLIVYYAHPGHKHSQTNRQMARVAKNTSGISFVDLYEQYPRFDIDVATEQQRLLDHDVILFQFPIFWNSTPSIIKEWQDLVLEHGFAYGKNGNQLAGKHLMLAVSGAGPEDAYTADGYQRYPLRTFLTPLEQTARLCNMQFISPFVQYASLEAAETGNNQAHIQAYEQLLQAIRDDRFDHDAASDQACLRYDQLPIKPSPNEAKN